MFTQKMRAAERLEHIKQIRAAHMAKKRGMPRSLGGQGLRYEHQLKLGKIARPPFAHYPEVFSRYDTEIFGGEPDNN